MTASSSMIFQNTSAISPIACPFAILWTKIFHIKFIMSLPSGKNLATPIFALKKTRSSKVSIFGSHELRSASSESRKAYFAPRLLVEKRLRYPSYHILTSMVISPSSWIRPVTGSLLAKNLCMSDSFHSPITTERIFGSMTIYLQLSL